MLRYSLKFGLLLAIWLLWAGSLTVQARIDAQQTSWGYQPAYTKISTSDPMTNHGVQSSAYFPSSCADSRLSDYTPEMSYSGPRRSRMFDDEPEGDPIGVVPVGEPLALLVMALLYVVYIRIRKQRV